MLVLTRKAGETIELSGGIVITIRSWTPTVATVTIAAPADVKIVRGELAKKFLDSLEAGVVGSDSHATGCGLKKAPDGSAASQ